MKLYSSTGFRATVICGVIIKESLDLSSKIPSYCSLLNWIHKIGYYELNKKKEKADDWVIILDESIQLGCDKVLVILGIRESEIDFTKPLKLQDLTPLREISRSKWNGELIKEEILNLKKEIGNISYAVGDYGNDIRKALKLLGITHVHDITHKIAIILKKILENNMEYKEITEEMSKMRLKLAQTEIASIIPPKQRKKSRYQNIKVISDWSLKAFNLMTNLHQRVEKLERIEDMNEKEKKEEIERIGNKIRDNSEWILSYENFIHELSEVNQVICDVEKIIKHKGLSESTIKQCNILLNKVTGELGIAIKEELLIYFKNTIEMFSDKKNILVTSDIIESAFGKYKNYISCNPMAGITNLVLCIAAFTSSLTNEIVKEALESTTIGDVRDWSEEFIGETLFQKRKKMLKCA